MPYKTIIHELLEQRPMLCDRLQQERQFLSVLETLAMELRTRHETWKQILATNQNIDPSQIPSAAMEMAVKEIESRLQLAFPAGDEVSLSLSDAVSFLRNPTPHD